LWVTLGGKSKIKNVFEAVLNYGTFDFKEKWLEDRINLFYKSLSKEKATQKAFMDYINDYGFYNYDILIPKYSVSYSMEFGDLWQMINNF